jgi:hypothetical protein
MRGKQSERAGVTSIVSFLTGVEGLVLSLYRWSQVERVSILASAFVSAQLRMRRATILIAETWAHQAARARWTVAACGRASSVRATCALPCFWAGRPSSVSAQLTRRRAAVMAILVRAHQAARARWTVAACRRTSSLVSLPNS